MAHNFEIIQDKDLVVFVGLACLDIIKVVENYPIEDQGNRCLDCMWRRGGNASNSSTVFSLLDGKTNFFGTMTVSDEMVFIANDFDKYKISYDKCPKIDGTMCPISIVILTNSTGTRTVLHTNKNLRELTLEDLKKNWDLSKDSVGWMHFEGRDNAFNISQMISYVLEYNQQCKNDNKGNDNDSNSSASSRPITISLEVEKLRLASGMDKYDLWKLPHVLFISKDFAKSQGYGNMINAAKGFYERVRSGAKVICAWGDLGAAAISEDEGLVTSSAFPPPTILDSCGAGDTFNAAVIRALSTGKTLQDAITFGCEIAGAKCGFFGFDDIKHIA